jgi:serine/threonine protein kinase
MTDQQQIDQILDVWADSRASGRESATDQLCAEYPHLRSELEQRIRAVRAIDALRLPRDASPTVTGAGTSDTPAPRDPRAPVAFAPAQRPGELGRLGGYRILKRLGEGGMGAVFLAEHDGLKRLDALKVMKPEAVASPQAKDRFLREARTAAAIKHDHVVTIYHVGEDNGVPFIAMELLEGESLEERLKQSPPLTPAEAARIGREVADGLAAAHARGLIHRDVKPGNIWLERKDAHPAGGPSSFRVKLLDFGLARPVDEDVQITNLGIVVGSPAYMSPEQAAGLVLDGRSDLFSLGVVMYRMTTGRLPFSGPNVLAILRQIDAHQPPPPHALNPAVPRPLSDLIMRLLAKAPDDRPASAPEVAAALRAIDRKGAADFGSPTTEYPAVGPKPTRRRGCGLTIAITITVSLLLLVGGVGLIVPALKHNLSAGKYGGSDVVSVPPASGPPASAPTYLWHGVPLPLKGWIDVTVWATKAGPRRRINRPENLPVRPGEFLRIEMEVNRPAYLYLVWLDTEGKATPLFPWEDEDWNKRPVEKPRTRLSLPEGEGQVAPIGGGPRGIESLLLLARETPLPADANLPAIFAGLPRQERPDVAASAWFENGELVRNELDRGAVKLGQAAASDDPILRTQALLRTKLNELFPYTRAVCFGNRGDR